jgi:16S rRNA (cytosine1402-N4)-methyltransferase
MQNMHQPVLVKEVVENLLTENSRIIVDATVGCGGHAQAILQKLKAEGRLIGLDRDQNALEIAKRNLVQFGKRIRFGHIRFSQMGSFLSTLDVKEVSGFLFDLGLCSLQLDQSPRGFSFQSDGPLDMRMDQTQSKSAYQVINRYSFSELNQILFRYGQERFSKKIARTIVNRRSQNPN